MTRTLADMTPDERAECVGMWFEWEGTDYLVVLASLNGPFEGHVTVMIPHPIKVKTAYTKMSTLIPRLDLPRAWTPSGEPVPGTWDDDNGHNSMRRFRSEREWKHDTPQHIIDQHTKVTT